MVNLTEKLSAFPFQINQQAAWLACLAHNKVNTVYISWYKSLGIYSIFNLALFKTGNLFSIEQLISGNYSIASMGIRQCTIR